MSEPSPFAEAIAKAATYEDHGKADPNAEWSPEDDSIVAPFQSKGKRPKNEQVAQDEAVAAFTDAAKRIGDEHGVSVVWMKPRIARKRTTAEYAFWKKPVMAFIEDPNTLDLGPTALAQRYAPYESNFTVTKDTFRAPLSTPARRAAGKLLKSRNYNLKLPDAFSIRDIQKAMKDQRDRAEGMMKFKPTIEIIGDTVFCDGKSFKMQPTGSGRKRIRAGKGWLPIESLTAFLSGQK